MEPNGEDPKHTARQLRAPSFVTWVEPRKSPGEAKNPIHTLSSQPKSDYGWFANGFALRGTSNVMLTQYRKSAQLADSKRDLTLAASYIDSAVGADSIQMPEEYKLLYHAIILIDPPLGQNVPLL